MRFPSVCAIIACIAGSVALCADAAAQSPATLGAAGPAAQEFERLKFIDFTASHGAVQLGGPIDAPATTVSGVYVKAGAVSALTLSTFPLTIGFNPFQRFANPNTSPFSNALAGSVLELSYAPLYLQQEPRTDVPTATHTVGHVSQAVTATYSIEAKNLDTLYLQGSALRRGGHPFATARQAWADSLRDLSLTTTTAYTATWDDTKRDQLAVSEVASKALPARVSGDRLISIEGAGSVSVFPPRHALKTFYGVSPSGAVRFVLINDIQLRLQVGVTHYLGDGFRGITGVVDKSRDTEVTLAQVLAFPVTGNQPLRFAVKEVHLGTGSADFQLSTEFSYKFADFRIPVLR